MQMISKVGVVFVAVMIWSAAVHAQPLWFHDCNGYYNVDWSAIKADDGRTQCENFAGSEPGRPGYCHTARYNRVTELWSTDLNCDGDSCAVTGYLSCGGQRFHYSLNCSTGVSGVLPKAWADSGRVSCETDSNILMCVCAPFGEARMTCG